MHLRERYRVSFTYPSSGTGGRNSAKKGGKMKSSRGVPGDTKIINQFPLPSRGRLPEFSAGVVSDGVPSGAPSEYPRRGMGLTINQAKLQVQSPNCPLLIIC